MVETGEWPERSSPALGQSLPGWLQPSLQVPAVLTWCGSHTGHLVREKNLIFMWDNLTDTLSSLTSLCPFFPCVLDTRTLLTSSPLSDLPYD